MPGATLTCCARSVLQRLTMPMLPDLVHQTRVGPEVTAVPLHDDQHHRRHERTEENDDRVDGQLQPQQQAIERQHEQDIELFIEILHSNGMAGRKQYMASVLE